MKGIDDLYTELRRKQAMLGDYSKLSKKLPAHGPRRQVLIQLINALHAEIRIIEWVVSEKIKLDKHMSDEIREGNKAWLK